MQTEKVKKAVFLNILQLILPVPDSFGHQSTCFIHVIKPDHPYFQHTKYEPDTSRHAREKWGVKIVLDFRTPCSCDCGTDEIDSTPLGQIEP